MSFTLAAVGGLCNRALSVLSYHRAHPESLRVLWFADVYVAGGRWSDVFEPLPNVTFVEELWNFDAQSWGPLGEFPPDYSELRPSAQVALEVANVVAGSGLQSGYAAIHVRRTDFTHLTLGYFPPTPDEQFDAFVQGLDPELPLYLATDNRETQEKFARKYMNGGHGMSRPRRVVTASQFLLTGGEVQGMTDHRRHGTFLHAAVDLFTCAGAAAGFKGTTGSTFTRVIEGLRGA